MNTRVLRFSALDTWFFREARPFEAIGGSELASVFPPSPRTLLGAVRSAMGDALGADWREFHKNLNRYSLPDGRRLCDLIGHGDDYGPLSMDGPWLMQGDERLYPVPACLLQRGATYIRLGIGPPTHSSLGNVRLPRLPADNAGAKTLERAWLTEAGFTRLLAGGVPLNDELRRAADLFAEESRLGIARDNARRVADEGLLYQTRHLRPQADLAIAAAVSMPESIDIDRRMVRFGGEGRLAHIQSRPGKHTLPPVPPVDEQTRGFLLMLLTPARLGDGPAGWLPPGFQAAEENGVKVWHGQIGKIDLTLHAAVIGKAVREGGWDQAAHQPRAVVSLIPAGSCYYVTVPGNPAEQKDKLAEAVSKLHGGYLGAERELGRGQIACGLWPRHEF